MEIPGLQNWTAAGQRDMTATFTVISTAVDSFAIWVHGEHQHYFKSLVVSRGCVCECGIVVTEEEVWRTPTGDWYTLIKRKEQELLDRRSAAQPDAADPARPKVRKIDL